MINFEESRFVNTDLFDPNCLICSICLILHPVSGLSAKPVILFYLTSIGFIFISSACAVSATSYHSAAMRRLRPSAFPGHVLRRQCSPWRSGLVCAQAAALVTALAPFAPCCGAQNAARPSLCSPAAAALPAWLQQCSSHSSHQPVHRQIGAGRGRAQVVTSGLSKRSFRGS